jgi:hypothetical protein
MRLAISGSDEIGGTMFLSGVLIGYALGVGSVYGLYRLFTWLKAKGQLEIPKV